jgi:hypothetical protein
MLSFASAAFTPDKQLVGTFSAHLDLLPGAAGEPLVVEVELTEPSLFLTAVPAAADTFAAAIRRAVAGAAGTAGRDRVR